MSNQIAQFLSNIKVGFKSPESQGEVVILLNELGSRNDDTLKNSKRKRRKLSFKVGEEKKLTDYEHTSLLERKRQELVEEYRTEFNQIFEMVEFHDLVQLDIRENQKKFKSSRKLKAELGEQLSRAWVLNSLQNCSLDFTFSSQPDQLGLRQSSWAESIVKFWRSYDFEISLSDSLVYFHSSLIPLFTTLNESTFLKKSKK